MADVEMTDAGPSGAKSAKATGAETADKKPKFEVKKVSSDSRYLNGSRRD